jgi:hypothetical protein
VNQNVVPAGQSCKTGAPGWCYVTGAAAGSCSQAILFANGTLLPGTQISLQCIESSSFTGTSDGG